MTNNHSWLSNIAYTMNLAKQRWKLQKVIFLIVMTIYTCSGQQVYYITPHVGSLCGETRIAIKGKDFSQHNTNEGNEVNLVSKTQSYGCRVEPDGTTEDFIICYTPPNMVEDTYMVRLIVNNQAVPEDKHCNSPTSYNCQFTPKLSNTPWIDAVEPQNLAPLSVIQLRGKIFTDLYDTNVATSSNGKTQRIVRVYAASKECSLKDTSQPNTFYEKVLETTGDKNRGNLSCKIESLAVGSHNASFIIDGVYGRSCRHVNTLHVSRTGKLYQFQTFAEITSITPAQGSTAGGQEIKIGGKYFNDKEFNQSPTATTVDIDGTTCAVNKVTATEITCITSPKPASTRTSFSGNRGLTLEKWSNTTKAWSDIEDIATFDGSETGYSLGHIEQSLYKNYDEHNFVSRSKGFFIPPFTGEYSFSIKAESSAALYVGTNEDPSTKAQIAKCENNCDTYKKYASQTSERRTLTAGNKYYVKVLHRQDSSGASFFQFAASYYNTKLTNHSTGLASQEHQIIKVKSTVVREVQKVTITKNSNPVQQKRNEIQEVEVTENTNAPTSAKYRLGISGAYTEPLNTLSTESDVQKVLQALPVFSSEDRIIVQRDLLNNDAKAVLRIEFDTKRGDIATLQYKTFPGSGGETLSITVIEKTKGVPDPEVFSLEFSGVPSRFFSYPSSVQEVTEGIDAMFSTQCPETLISGGSKHYRFETKNLPSGLGGQWIGDGASFCGKGMVMNPSYVYRDNSGGLRLSSGLKTICFAYNGMLRNKLALHVSKLNDENAFCCARTHYLDVTFETTSGWHYFCYDMLEALRTAEPSVTAFKLLTVQVFRLQGDVYVDEVFIGRVPTTADTKNAHLLRLLPALPNNQRMKGVTVQQTSTDLSTSAVYQITLIPHSCGHNFPKFKTVQGQKGSNLGISIDRPVAASPPVGGTFKVSFKGKTSPDIPYDISGADFKEKLNAHLQEMGDLFCYRKGDCANFELGVTFLSLAGDQETLQVNHQLTGTGINVLVDTAENGSLTFNPIQGDMLLTYEGKPQVLGYVNGIPTKCAQAGSCSYEWTSSQTPKVTGSTPASGVPNVQSITISGTNFELDKTKNKVAIGGVDCTVTGSTSNSITCKVGYGPAGTHPIKVTVDGKGRAMTDSPVTFTYEAKIISISPNTGNVGGGIDLTVNGYGFSSGDKIHVGDGNCPVKSASGFKIICTVPHSPTIGAKSVKLTPANSAQMTAADPFTFTASGPLISSVTPAIVSVQGGQELTIQGANFDLSSTLIINSKVVATKTLTAVEVKADLPPLPPGTHQVKLLGASGIVSNSQNQIPTIEVRLVLKNVHPLFGSQRGGTRLTLTGEGFSSTKADNEVKVGDHTICDVETASATKLVCLIKDTGRLHKVDNSGLHPEFKVTGYAWNPKYIQVTVGDEVEWNWGYKSYIQGMRPRVVQVKDETSEEEVVDGFSSGEPTSKGLFRHRFNVPGKYYYWSGHIDVYKTTQFRGTVYVVEQSSSLAEVSLKVSGFTANHDKSGTAPSDNGPCPVGPTQKPSCSVPMPTGGDSAKWNFAFWECATPVINSISRSNGTTADTINIQGTLPTTSTCQNEVKFGDAVCFVNSFNAAGFSCKILSNNKPPIGVLKKINYRHNNMGNARIAITGMKSRSFSLIPYIASINPAQGSTSGGTLVTVTGTGFSDDSSLVKVLIGDYPCPVVTASYTSLVCSTIDLNTQGKKPLTVFITSPLNQKVPTECGLAKCEFEFAASSTPKITGVSPSAIDGQTSTSFTISGMNFKNNKADVAVRIGGQTCTISTATAGSISCDITNLPVGSNQLEVVVSGFGKASGSVAVTSPALIASVLPAQGSIHGGTLVTLTGNGFVDGTTVTMDKNLNVACTVKSLSLTQITCISGPHAAGIVDVIVKYKEFTFSQKNFEYSSAATPTITTVSPSKGKAGDVITIDGQNLSPLTEVKVGEVECLPTGTPSGTQIQCTLSAQGAGSYPVSVSTPAGKSNNNKNVEYYVTLSAVNPTSGSLAGGQELTVLGTGFDTNIKIEICGQECITQGTPTAVQIKCLSPVSTTATSCDVIATSSVHSLLTPPTLPSAYTYDSSETATVSEVDPRRGGTGGGTLLTIKGSRFTNIKGKVTIDGSECAVSSWADTLISCQTGAHSGTGTFKVKVHVQNYGIADPTSADYFYIDVWSSRATWGNSDPPVEGDLAVISSGQTVLLDVNTPKLEMILINGGSLIFDEKDIELNAQRIFINNGGLLQVGTEKEPFQHKATIIMHGHVKSKELPIYGTKGIGLRNGSLELHGQPVTTTWTTLDKTVNAGSSNIELTHEVSWKAGDQIIIATTSHRHSQKESEVRTIASVDKTKKILTLTKPVTYKHLGVTETFNGVVVPFRAEVGLLTRNVVVRGSVDSQWTEKIEACPDGFDTGEFARNKCFLGRFGEEIGSDQFGAQILIHAPSPNQNLVKVHIEYIEMEQVGQAFRLGRYPIHFHLNGDMAGSYVRGSSIYNSFNRAVNIHGTHNVMVEFNTIYNIMGGAMFLEDGIETGSVFRYNLAVFVKESTSLQNDDITPAGFWATNPNNTFEHNHVAGGTHFGFWYRMHPNPTGPSFTRSICPQHVPLLSFRNNTVHSNGWFGLWVFETMKSRVGGGCNSKVPFQSTFEGLTAWNTEKGAEFVNGGSFKFKNFILVNNKLAGTEGKLSDEGEQVIEDTLIVGHANSLTREEQGCTRSGVVVPYGYNFKLSGVTFVNFNEAGCAAIRATRIQGICSWKCGGYLYTVEGLNFVNSPNKGQVEWQWEVLIRDLDGSLITDDGGNKMDNAGKTVVTPANTLPPSPTCVDFPKFKMGSQATKACSKDLKFHRFAFNKISPSALNYKAAMLTNQHGTTTEDWRKKDTSHPKGWMTVLLDGETYLLEFRDAQQLTNVSYNGRYDNMQDDNDHVIMRQNIKVKPDRFIVSGSTSIPKPDTPINPLTSSFGHWEYDGAQSEVKYIVNTRAAASTRKKRSSPLAAKNVNVGFKVVKCYWKDCKPPPDPNTVPPATVRPDDAEFWSVSTTWKDAEAGWGGNLGNGQYDLPKDGDDVKIPLGKWVVGDTTLPHMGKLVLYGVLELDDNNGTRDFELRCTYLIIMGGRLIIGWPDKPFLSKALILLEGNHSTTNYPRESGPNIGSKVIGAFGGLDLHGIDKGITWTELVQTANVGENKLYLKDTVSWSVGDKIVVAPTGYRIQETETFHITGISGAPSVLTLDTTLKYKHISHTHTANGKTIKMAAEVGVLTRNIKVEGASYDKLYKESFGARILVSQTTENDQLHIGKWCTEKPGYARIFNVEFYHTGQEGWVEPFDSRSSIAFIDAGKVTNIKPSYIRKNAFYKSFSPGVTVYGTNELPVEWNVLKDNVWYAIESKSDKTVLRHNLILRSQWEGCYQDRDEALNVRFNGAINVDTATNLVLEYNHVAGAERLGFNVLGETCSTPSTWKDNVAHTTLIGVGHFQSITKVPAGIDCLQLANFTVWKNLDYGIYYNNLVNHEVRDLKAADNGVAVFQFIIGPSAASHQFADKYAKVTNSLIVGMTDSFDCASDVIDTNDCNIKRSQQGRFHSNPKRTGVTMATFSSGGNKAPEKPLANIKSYQAIKGHFLLDGVTFSKFSGRCDGTYAVVPNNGNDDGNHPFETRNIVLSDVDDDHKVFFWRSSLKKINSADCVDMACDAKVKAYISDLDGTFLGKAGFVIPQSEFDWNGNLGYQLGDYRIPKAMLTTKDGTRIPVDTKFPNKDTVRDLPEVGLTFMSRYIQQLMTNPTLILKVTELFKERLLNVCVDDCGANSMGIVRDSSCTYQPAWQAYKCHDLTYKTLTIESLDSDSETRRVSPVAIAADGYIDLINGPQDHGWCFGYTCRRRLSTFQAIVAIGKKYELQFTGTNPQKLRFIMLNSNDNECIRLSIFYTQPWRLEIKHDNVYVEAENGRYVQIPGKATQDYVIDPPPAGKPDFYLPKVNGCQAVSGANYYDRNSNTLFVIIKGSKPVTITTMPSVIVSFQFPAMTVEVFYDQNIVEHLAAFLDLDQSRVRIAEITRENVSSGRRKKRQAVETVTGCLVEISNTPGPNGTTTLTRNDLQNISQTIVNHIQLSNFSDIINCSSSTTYSIAKPPPDTNSSEWSNTTNDSPYTVVQQADHMIFTKSIVPLHEGVPFSTQPHIQVVDKSGAIIKLLGSEDSPWEITASIRAGTGNPMATLIGETSVKFQDGLASFSNMAISHFGTGYVVDFRITDPVEGENFTISSDPLTIKGRPLKAQLVSKTRSMIENVATSFVLELRDEVTSEVIQNIAWRNHSWSVSADLDMPELYQGTEMTAATVLFNVTTGQATFDNLLFRSRGSFVVKFTITSSPGDYSFHYYELVSVIGANQVNMVIDITQELAIKFDADYDKIVGAMYMRQMMAMMGYWIANTFQYNVIPTMKGITRGSIIVTFNVGGSNSSVNSTILALCDSIQNGTSFMFNGNSLTLSTFMTVDGVTYYGVHCGPTSSNDDDDLEGILPIILAVSVVGGVLVIAVIVLIVWMAWKCKISPKTKTHDFSNAKYFGQHSDIDEILFREKSFMSIRSSKSPAPPTSTALTLTGEKRYPSDWWKY